MICYVLPTHVSVGIICHKHESNDTKNTSFQDKNFDGVTKRQYKQFFMFLCLLNIMVALNDAHHLVNIRALSKDLQSLLLNI